MALLKKYERERRLKYLGYDGYNSKSVKAFQKKAFPDQKKQQDGKYGINTDRALRHFYNVKKVTKDFSPTEFRCNCGHCTGYPSYMKQVELKHLQKIRDHYGKPMTITSGLRCSYENSRVGGVRNSGHTRGYAADFYMKGVTDTVANRKRSLKWIERRENHEFTYGAYMNDSNGMYRVAAGMGNAMHTETHAPKSTLTQLQKDILEACAEQAECQKNAKYKWEPDPTPESSEKNATCVTYGGCVGQRVKKIRRGGYIWHDTKGKVTHLNKNMTAWYPNKKLKYLKNFLKAGDYVMVGDKTDVGAGSHVFIFHGKWKGDIPYVWDHNSARIVKKTENTKNPRSGLHLYDDHEMCFAIVRLK